MKKHVKNLINKNAPRSIVLMIDLLIISVNFFITYLIISNFSLDFDLRSPFLQIPYVALIALFVFLAVGSYKGVIRHTGLRDTINIYVSSTLLSLMLLLFSFIINKEGSFIHLYISVSIIVVYYLLNIITLITSRFLFKAIYKALIGIPSEVVNVIIYGGGEMGTNVYSALKKNTEKKYKIVCFIDDDSKKVGRKIDRVSILKPSKVDRDFIKENEIKEVVLAIKEVPQKKLLEISDHFLKLSLKIKLVPPISKWVDGELEVNQIKEINLEDLLNRTPISLDKENIKFDVESKVVLVTGAAGSIGSEIVQQLSVYKCDKIILIDFSESALYELEQNLIRAGHQNIYPFVSDVRDLDVMDCLFEKFRPQLVFHAAAYKHVPLMENNPYEAVRINVVGTKNIADLSDKFNVEKFVMVSTDKAVNPTNVMGATKRVAEMYVTCKQRQKNISTKYIITRFGNVLGSNGSVIPLFKKQIANGGPITLTHPKITRYFMTIPEACQLVLEAGSMGDGGEIFIFDMGESVKIMNLALRMIRLSGLRYPEDIDIEITGLRPGEKLYEELLNNDEDTLPTHHKKIMISNVKSFDNTETLTSIDKLIHSNRCNNELLIVENLKKIVPEYISNNSVYEKLDKK